MFSLSYSHSLNLPLVQFHRDVSVNPLCRTHAPLTCGTENSHAEPHSFGNSNVVRKEAANETFNKSSRPCLLILKKLLSAPAGNRDGRHAFGHTGIVAKPSYATSS